jgi:hypothetical protein
MNKHDYQMKVAPGLSALLFPRLRDMLFITIFVGAIMVGPRMVNGDLGRHLVLGKYMVTTLSIPTRDLFSFTKPSQSRPPYEWLAQVVLYFAYRILNMDGVVILTALVLAMTFVVVFIDSFHRSSMPVLAAFLSLWAGVSSSIDWLTRPHVLSFFFLALWLMWLERIRKNENISLWWFPLLMLVWANSHGGFILGILAWVAYLSGWAWEAWRHRSVTDIGRNLMIIGGTSLIASVLTPDLWRNWQGVLANNSIYILSHTSETKPPDFSVIGTLPFTCLLVLVLISFFLYRKRYPVSHILLLVGLALISLLMARNVPYFAIAAAPILIGDIGTLFREKSVWNKFEDRVARIETGLKGYVWPALAMITAIGFFAYYQSVFHAPFDNFNPQAFPVRAVDWLESHPQSGNMFNDFNWGGYLLYRLWPEDRVFIDSQSDFYGETLTRQYAEILSGQGDWEANLRQYNIGWLIVSPQSGLARSASGSPEWSMIYEDASAVIFVRK